MVSDLTVNQDIRKNIKQNNELRAVKILKHILIALEAFKGNYHKKLNFDKLKTCLNLSNHDADRLLTLILEFQELFKDTFIDHHLKKKIINNIEYLIVKKDSRDPVIPTQIHMTYSNAKLLSDITYTFKHVSRGKGFNLQFTNTELLKSIKKMNAKYPYLFVKNGNNLTYPSEIGLSIGERILSYSKNHKKLTDIKINNYTIIFEEDQNVRT